MAVDHSKPDELFLIKQIGTEQDRVGPSWGTESLLLLCLLNWQADSLPLSHQRSPQKEDLKHTIFTGKNACTTSSPIYCINPLPPPNSVTGGLSSSGQNCGAHEKLLEHEPGDGVSWRGLPPTPWPGLGGGMPLLIFFLKTKTMSCTYCC